jgi:hypothetical protein
LPKSVLLAAAGFLLATTIVRADTQLTPSWLKVDPASKKAEVDVIAAFNDNNTSWNFNGYHTGNATVLIPLGWTVEMAFRNQEAEIPHSLVVIADPGDETQYPQEAGEDTATFAGAHTKNPIEGTGVQGGDRVSFQADKAGDFLWYCGVPGHGLAGMWIRFRAADDVQAPALMVTDEAEPGRE